MGSYHLEDSGQECLGSLSDEGGGSPTAGLRQLQHRLGLRRLPRIGRRCHARLSGCGKVGGPLAASDRLGESTALLARVRLVPREGRGVWRQRARQDSDPPFWDKSTVSRALLLPPVHTHNGNPTRVVVLGWRATRTGARFELFSALQASRMAANVLLILPLAIGPPDRTFRQLGNTISRQEQ
jgi:hypothetical protein